MEAKSYYENINNEDNIFKLNLPSTNSNEENDEV